ncbi:hypothetical protein BDZ91DRAFT_39843 [Kalaharituber pfeilii]|nr:hypothetical protein BDZ91DRAFT_39843 [Kalaharituber pfeilii]
MGSMESVKNTLLLDAFNYFGSRPSDPNHAKELLYDGVYYYGTGKLPPASTLNGFQSPGTNTPQSRSYKVSVSERDMGCVITGVEICYNGTQVAHIMPYHTLNASNSWDNPTWMAARCFLPEEIVKHIFHHLKDSPASGMLTLGATLHQMWAADSFRLYPVTKECQRRTVAE